MFHPDVQAAFGAPPSSVAPAFLALDEGQWFERKSARVSPKDLAIPMIAMANAEGGTIVVGLHGGSVEDVGAVPGRINDLLQTPVDHTRPPVRARGRVVPCLDETGRPATLLVFVVEPGETVHESPSGESYLRVGDESRRLGFQQRQELTYDRGPAPFDGTGIDATMAELDEHLIEEFRLATGASLGTDTLLAARSLVHPAGRLTVAAYLLFGRKPEERMPHAHVRVLRYADVDRGTGRRLSLDADADIRCEGPLPRAIQAAAEVIERVLPKRRALGVSGRFEAVPIVPRDAWLEGLVNAVVHRSYSAAGDHIRVEVFPNRIEIESPGRFPGIVDPGRPLEIRRYARNPRIARVCADLNIGRELGEGIHRMFDEMRLAGLSDPVFEQTPQTTRLILPASLALPAELRNLLPRGYDRILSVLRSAGAPLGTGDIVEASGLSRPTVTKALTLLEAAGYLEWSGRSAKDPRATWSPR